MGAAVSGRVILAVDGGNSKTDVALVTEAGRVLSLVRGPGSSPQALGVDGSVRLLDSLVREARTQAGGHAPDAGGRPVRAEVYLAGADLPGEIDRLREAVARAGWAAESVVDNDAFALLRTGTEHPDAVAAVCGAGINCVGRARDGRTAAFPALGRTTGDWGGGVQLGYEALWLAARAEDGRGRPTDLRTAVAAHFGCDTVLEVGEAMHFGAIGEGRVAELAPVLFAAAEAGDETARGVVERLAEEFSSLAGAMLGRLRLRGRAAVVVLGGGVVRAQHRVLEPLVTERLRATAPEAEIVVVTERPVLGAALAGLDAVGADEGAKRRLAVEIRYAVPAPARPQ